MEELYEMFKDEPNALRDIKECYQGCLDRIAREANKISTGQQH